MWVCLQRGTSKSLGSLFVLKLTIFGIPQTSDTPIFNAEAMDPWPGQVRSVQQNLGSHRCSMRLSAHAMYSETPKMTLFCAPITQDMQEIARGYMGLGLVPRM